MRRGTCIAALACVAALAVPAVAYAKGASEATIAGPGLERDGIVLSSDRGANPTPGSALARFARAAGFSSALFSQPGPLQRDRPTGDLGARYTITYTLPGPSGEMYELRQHLYPYAAGGPLVYTPAGQRIWARPPTTAGWFRAGPNLKPLLDEIGVPASPRAGSAEPGYEVSWAAAGLVALVVGSLGAALAALFRRRPGTLVTR